MPGDIPQRDPGMPSRSRYPSEASQSDFNVALVPGEPNVLTPTRVEAQSIGDATHVEGTPDTSLEESHNNNSLFRHRLFLGPFPSNSPNPSILVGPTLPQNLHVGADVSDTHHATNLRDYVGSVAFQSHPVAQQPGQAAVHLCAEPVQVAAFERDAALAAILHDQERAIATPDGRDGGVGLTGFNISQFAQQGNLGDRPSFQQEVQTEHAVMHGEVDQRVETTVRPPQSRPMLGNQHVAIREFGITETDSKMFPNEHQLAATQQRHRVALVSPDSINPSYQNLDNQNVFEDPAQVPSTFVQYPNLAANNMLSPTHLQHAPDSMKAVAFPTDVNVTGRETPTVSGGPSILGNQQLADMKIGITVRDSRIALNEHQLAATQQRHRVALVPPDSINSSSQTLDRQYVFEDLSAVPSTAVQHPNPASPLLSPNNPKIPDTLQVVDVPTVVEATGRITHNVSGRNFGITEKDSRMFPNEHQLAATQQRHRVALVSPDSINSTSQTLDRQYVFEDLSAVPSTAVQHPNPASPLLPTNNPEIPDTLQVVDVPTVVEAAGRATLNVSGRDFEITEKDSRMFPNEHQLAATQQRQRVALVSPDSITGPPVQSGESQFNPQNISGTLQVVAVPTVVEATGRVTHRVPDSGHPTQPGESHCQSSNVAAQNAVASMPQPLHHSGI